MQLEETKDIRRKPGTARGNQVLLEETITFGGNQAQQLLEAKYS